MKLKIYLASKNKKKIREIQDILGEYNIEVCLPDESTQFPSEESDTFKGNALNKALFLSRLYSGSIIIGEDSGLVVPALNGKPGIYSARFAGPKSSSRQNIKKLLKYMENIKKRDAYFICTCAVVFPAGEYKIFEGRLHGIITRMERGKSGFGYDPVFEIPGLKQTIAELSAEIKNKISHRSKVLKKVGRFLKKYKAV